MKLLDEVLKEIKPLAEDESEYHDKLDSVLKKINSRLKNAKAILGGSGAKGTRLKGNYEADLFVLFDYKKYNQKSDEISAILEKAIKPIFKDIKKLHGSRDYFQIRDGKFKFEILPILNIKKADQAMNITDISPLHAKWVNKHRKLRNDMLLTKKFCKANNVYGAESYIKGFSGYICEILTVNYGSFMKLLRAAARWNDKEIIDVERYFKNKNDAMFELNKSKTYSPLVVIDPVQKGRNAAAALSDEKFRLFKAKAKEFLKNPSKKFFKKEKLDIDKLRKKAKSKKLVILDVICLEGKEDIVGAKLLKCLEHIKRELLFNEFKLYDHGWEWDKEKNGIFYLIVDKKPLSKTKIQAGPPLYSKNHVEIFRKKHNNAFVKNKRLYANVERRFTEAENLISQCIKSDYIKERSKSIKIR